MSPALIQIFAFMTCTFLLGLFLGFALWRFGGISRAAMDDLEAKAQFLKQSLEKSRMELWSLQEKHGIPVAQPEGMGTPSARRRIMSRTSSKDPILSRPSQPAES